MVERDAKSTPVGPEGRALEGTSGRDLQGNIICDSMEVSAESHVTEGSWSSIHDGLMVNATLICSRKAESVEWKE